MILVISRSCAGKRSPLNFESGSNPTPATSFSFILAPKSKELGGYAMVNRWKYGVVAVLISALLIACVAAGPTPTRPIITTPPAQTGASGESIETPSLPTQASGALTETPSLVEQLAPAPTTTPIPTSASFSASGSAGNAPLTVNFTDTSEGLITSRKWDFGDGDTGTNQNSVHVYNIAGTYTVQLTPHFPYG